MKTSQKFSMPKNKTAPCRLWLCLVFAVAARTLFAPYELPVGIVMSLTGAPFFIWLLLHQRGGRTHD